MRIKTIFGLLFVALLTSDSPAFGEPVTTYTYTGQFFNLVSAPFTTSDFISVSMTFPRPLAPNLTNDVLDAILWYPSPSSGVSWSVSDGVTVINPENGGVMEMTISTDSTAAIILWSYESLEYYDTTEGFNQIIIAGSGNIGGIACSPCGSDTTSTYAFALSGGFLDSTTLSELGGFDLPNTAPGVWTATTTPEPATIVLIGLGLFGVTVVTNCQKKR